jgi:hypothetical protein
VRWFQLVNGVLSVTGTFDTTSDAVFVPVIKPSVLLVRLSEVTLTEKFVTPQSVELAMKEDQAKTAKMTECSGCQQDQRG